MLDILVYVAIAVIVVLVIWWLIQQVGLPPPAQQIVTIGIVVVVAILVIMALLSVAGHGPGWRLSQRSMIVDPKPLSATVEIVRQDLEPMASPTLALADGGLRRPPIVQGEPA